MRPFRLAVLLLIPLCLSARAQADVRLPRVPEGVTARAEALGGASTLLWLDVPAWPSNRVLRVHGITRPPSRVTADRVEGPALRWLQADAWMDVFAPATGAPPARVAAQFPADPGWIRLDAVADERQVIDIPPSTEDAPAGGPRVFIVSLRQPGRYALDLRVPPGAAPRLRIADAEVALQPASADAAEARYTAAVDLASSGVLRVELAAADPSGPPPNPLRLRLQPARAAR